MRTLATALIATGLATGVGALVVLHLLPTGLSPLQNAVSQYGISRYAVGYRVQTLGYAVAGAGAALGTSLLPGATGTVVALCALFAAARAAISWSPMDVPGGPRTSTGARHGLLAIAAFVGLGAAAWRLATLLQRQGIHPGIARASDVLATLMTVCLVGMFVARRGLPRFFGLVERGFYACATGWLALVAVLATR